MATELQNFKEEMLSYSILRFPQELHSRPRLQSASLQEREDIFLKQEWPRALSALRPSQGPADL